MYPTLILGSIYLSGLRAGPEADLFMEVLTEEKEGGEEREPGVCLSCFQAAGWHCALLRSP